MTDVKHLLSASNLRGTLRRNIPILRKQRDAALWNFVLPNRAQQLKLSSMHYEQSARLKRFEAKKLDERLAQIALDKALTELA